MESKNEERAVKNSPFDNDKEIDIGIEIFKKIQRAFSKVFKIFASSLLFLFQVIRKRLLLLGISAFLGAGAGILLYSNTTPTYYASMIVTSRLLKNLYCAEMIDNLQLIIDDKSYNLLAKTLKVSKKVAEQIDEIEYNNLYEIEENEDTVILGLPFKISLFVYDPVVIDTMQTAIINFLENNEYSLKRRKIRKKKFELLEGKFKKEVLELDSLKWLLASAVGQRANASGFNFGEPLDPLNVYREVINFYKKQLDYNSQQILINNIQVISPFMPREKPDSPKLLLNIIIGGLIAFFIGFLIALRLEVKRSAKLN